MKERNNNFDQSAHSFDEFGLQRIDFTIRVPEKSEIFSNEEAHTYIEGCDYPESVDDLLLAWEIKERFPHLNKMEVLDAMCGPGRLGRELLQLGAKSVTFHDGHGMMLNHAQKEATSILNAGQEIQGVLSQVDNMPIPDNSFDLVVCHNSTHQLSDVERLSDTMREFLRVTKPGGIILIADYQRSNGEDFRNALDERLRATRPDIIPLLIPTFTAAFSKDEFASAITSLEGVKNWKITDAQPPHLSRRMKQRVATDPVKGHFMDFSKISQRIVIQKG